MLQTDIFYRFNFNLNFIGDLSLTAGKELNVKEATIVSQNINQEGLDTSKITTKEVKKEDVKPQYGDIAKGAAITGAIAGAIVVASELIVDKFGKPTMETSKGDALTKPTDELAKTEAFKAKYPDYNGTTPEKIRPNMGSANTVEDINKVFQPVKPLNPLKEGSSVMGGIESNVPGMHGLASDWHDPFVHKFTIPASKNPIENIFLVKPANLLINQGTILPFTLGNYCVQFPTACASITGATFGDRPNK